MRRSAFLGLGVGALGAVALAPLDRAAAERETLEITLRSAPFRFAPRGTGISFDGLAYEGRIPGPVLRVRHGQRLRVRYVNESGVPSTIHWHGMILPNAMDGVPGVTQPAVPPGGEFLYAFTPTPPGTRWYHDHVDMNLIRGLFGMIVVEDPRDPVPDAEFALVFHDVPSMRSVVAASRGISDAPMDEPEGSREMAEMRPGERMGDEVRYIAHCIDGDLYPYGRVLRVKVGDLVRLRILNASPTVTRYIRLAGHRLRVTHTDGNPLERPVEVDVLRVGTAERLDAWFEVRRPGAWLLQGLGSDALAYQQAVVVATPGMENAAPVAVAESLDDAGEIFDYRSAAGTAHALPVEPVAARRRFTLGGGRYGSGRWTIDGRVWPHVPPLDVRRGERLLVRFENRTDMEHPMHLHGHLFHVVEVGGTPLARPLPKDTALVPANGGTMSWLVTADAPPGRWLLHCHNEIHMMDGMATEMRYIG
jgi:FtsP/CotA-like multicopper oxidase with cupredoxin domain